MKDFGQLVGEKDNDVQEFRVDRQTVYFTRNRMEDLLVFVVLSEEMVCQMEKLKIIIRNKGCL